jgi:hypothetical protein
MTTDSPQGAPQTRDYFAELYVAGMFGDAGWTVYFPKRDVGFDFIATKAVNGQILLRPVQVKGKYPVKDGKDGNLGFAGKLSAVHPDMVLVIPYFDAHERGMAPSQVAYMPFSAIRPRTRGGYRAVPAKFQGNRVVQRRQFQHLFGEKGLAAVEGPTWGALSVSDDSDESEDVQAAS